MKADPAQRQQVEEDRPLLLRVDRDQLAAMPPERRRVQHLQVGGLPAHRRPVVDDLQLYDTVARPELPRMLAFPPAPGASWRTLRRKAQYTRDRSVTAAAATLVCRLALRNARARAQRERCVPRLVDVACCICGVDDSEPIAVGEDFEYRTSSDTFQAVRCQRCGLVYLDPRPAVSEFDRIYPPSYHAFDFSAERFGLVYQVRRRLEARRLLSGAAAFPTTRESSTSAAETAFTWACCGTSGGPAGPSRASTPTARRSKPRPARSCPYATAPFRSWSARATRTTSRS